MVTEVNNDNFQQEVLDNDKLVVVDFWANWCSPCKAMMPLIEQASEERNDVKFVKANVEDNPELAQKFGVRSLPTLIAIKDGHVQTMKMGGLSRSEIDDFINEAV